MEILNLIMQAIGYMVIVAILLSIAYIVVSQKKTYATACNDHMEDDEMHHAFESWLVNNYQWNGCGWTDRSRPSSIVQTTENLYKHFISVNYSQLYGMKVNSN